MNEANAAVAYLSTDDLKELLNDDDKLEERINDVVSELKCKFNAFYLLMTQLLIL